MNVSWELTIAVDGKYVESMAMDDGKNAPGLLCVWTQLRDSRVLVPQDSWGTVSLVKVGGVGVVMYGSRLS